MIRIEELATPSNETALLSYDKAETRLFFEHCYLFDMQKQQCVVAYRAPSKDAPIPTTVSDRLTAEEWDVMEKHLMKVVEQPLICRCGGELCILVPSLAGSASLGLLIFPHMEEERFLCLARRDADFFAFAPGCEPPTGCRSSAKTRAMLPQYEAILRDIRCCLCNLLPTSPYGVERDIGERLAALVADLSSFCGCPVRLAQNGPLLDHGDLDVSLLTAFLLMSLLMARRISRDRRAEVILTQSREGCSATVRFAMAEDEQDYWLEHSTLSEIANQKNLLFEAGYADGLCELRLLPMRVDWSYLGLKQRRLEEVEQ